jgi:hypothetical protein
VLFTASTTTALASALLRIFGLPATPVEPLESFAELFGISAKRERQLRRALSQAVSELELYASSEFRDLDDADRGAVHQLLAESLSQLDQRVLLLAASDGGARNTLSALEAAQKRLLADQLNEPSRAYLRGLDGRVAKILAGWMSTPDLRAMAGLEGLLETLAIVRAPAEPTPSPSLAQVAARGAPGSKALGGAARVAPRSPNNAVISGASGSGRTAVLQGNRPPGHANHTHDDLPMGSPEIWTRLTDGAEGVAHLETLWRQILLLVCLTQVHAHRERLTAENSGKLDSLMEALPPQLFRHPGLKTPFTIASALAFSPQSLRDAFAMRVTWDDVATFLSRLKARERISASLLIDDVDQFFDNDPQLMIQVISTLARQILRHDQACGLVRTRLVIRNSIRDYWLKAKGEDLAQLPGFIDMESSKSALRRLYEDSTQQNAHLWVGGAALAISEKVHVHHRAADEELFEYVVRHTYMTPKSLKKVLDSLIHRRAQSESPLTNDEIVRIVNDRAWESAVMCLHQVASDVRAMVPRHGPEVPIQATTEDAVLKLVRQHADELITRDQLETSLSRLSLPFAPYLIDALWRHRLLLYAPANDSRAYCSGSSSDRLDYANQELRFHPSLIEIGRLRTHPGVMTLEYL